MANQNLTREQLERAVVQAQGNTREAAERLGLAGDTSLLNRLRKKGLQGLPARERKKARKRFSILG